MTELTTVPENLSLVALSPADIAPTQARLADWCFQKMRSLGQDYKELAANLRVAKRNRWSRGGLMKAVALVKRRIQYYQKMRLAVQAGYLIIPNFPMEVMAVRVGRNAPPWKEGRWPSDVNEAQAQLLPAGEGRYVDEMTVTRQLSPHVDEKGNKTPRVEAGQYNEEVDFPTIAVKPVVMEAAAQAMALRLFDQIGIAWKGGQTTSHTRKRSDPIVIGRLIDPRSTTPWNRREVSFFIAWWLNTSDL